MSSAPPALESLPQNIGVYTDPEHNLYVAPAEPSAEDVALGKDLKEGEVILQMKSTGICGYVLHIPPPLSRYFPSPLPPAIPLLSINSLH